MKLSPRTLRKKFKIISIKDLNLKLFEIIIRHPTPILFKNRVNIALENYSILKHSVWELQELWKSSQREPRARPLIPLQATNRAHPNHKLLNVLEGSAKFHKYLSTVMVRNIFYHCLSPTTFQTPRKILQKSFSVFSNH